MLNKRVVLTLAALAVLVVAPASQPSVFHSTALDATGVISGAENSYTLRITNTGTEPIKCFVLDPAAGVVITGGSGRFLWTVAAQQGRLAGLDLRIGIAPGDSEEFTFTTAGPYPERAGGDLYVSATCQPGSDVKRTATGPNPTTVSPPPPPAGSAPPPRTVGVPAECTCKSITTKVTRTALNFTDQARWHFQLSYEIACTGGGAKRCFGHIEIEPPKGYKATTKLPGKGTFACLGKCGKKNQPQMLFVGGPHPQDMNSNAERRNKTVVFRFRRSCGTLSGADHKELGVSKLVVVYNGKGIPDQKRSDFNADGIADGQQ